MVMKMNNKVLVKIILESSSDNYDLFIPVNEYIWRIKKLIVKSLTNKTDNNDIYILVNADTGQIYDDNLIVLNTDIRNGSELLFLNIK